MQSGPPLISRSTEPPELLEEHSREVGLRARAAAAVFGADIAGLWSGIFHDFGKAKPAVQEMLRGTRSRSTETSHAAEGAARVHAILSASNAPNPDPVAARCLAHVIAAHHSGLQDGCDLDGLLKRATDTRPSDPAWLGTLLAPWAPPAPLARAGGRQDAFALCLFVRMLLSVLVDADRSAAAGLPHDEPELAAGLDVYVAAFHARIAELAGCTSASPELAAFREAVRTAASAQATLDPGLFSMTVPTGGGKTLASLGFALAHAAARGLRRIVYVAPFTAIVEQVADELRQAVGDDLAVLEHHSAVELADEADEQASARREAEARWDTPIVVTTAVQLFESLFSASPSRCRKLHRLARSVVILDEAQALPRKVLRPCLAAIAELARSYGASVVLMTATQPCVLREDGFGQPEALTGVREIGPPPEVPRPAPRVRAERVGVLSDAELLERIADSPRCLTIVNNRRHARELFAQARASGIDGLVHLSTAMMPAHRRLALKSVRAKLASGAPCRLISTSVVEAGVDVDFPMVMRAMAGLDQIVQAAGRCNREGRLGREGGRLILFDVAPGKGRAAPPELRDLANETRQVLDLPLEDDVPVDPLGEAALSRFFHNLYHAKRGLLDTTEVQTRAMNDPIVGVMKSLEISCPDRLPLAAIGRSFRMIEEAGAPIVIPATYGIGAPQDLLDELEHAESARGLARRLQPFCVSVPSHARARMMAEGHLIQMREDDFGGAFPALFSGLVARDRTCAERPSYDSETGLNWTDETYPTGEAMMV